MHRFSPRRAVRSTRVCGCGVGATPAGPGEVFLTWGRGARYSYRAAGTMARAGGTWWFPREPIWLQGNKNAPSLSLSPFCSLLSAVTGVNQTRLGPPTRATKESKEDMATGLVPWNFNPLHTSPSTREADQIHHTHTVHHRRSIDGREEASAEEEELQKANARNLPIRRREDIRSLVVQYTLTIPSPS
jgi:hypothetical protein